MRRHLCFNCGSKGLSVNGIEGRVTPTRGKKPRVLIRYLANDCNYGGENLHGGQTEAVTDHFYISANRWKCYT